MLISSTDIIYLGGAALVTGLAALLPVGLASRYSIFSVDEEAPPWVSQTWSSLHSFSNGVFCTLAVQLVIQAGQFLCSGTSYPVGQHIAAAVILVTFVWSTVLDVYIHMVLSHKEKMQGYTKLVLPLDIIKKKLSKISRSQKGEKRSIDESLLLKTELNIPKIETVISSNEEKILPPRVNENSNTYVSLSEVDHSKISPHTVTPACTPSTEYPTDQGSPFREKNSQNRCQDLSVCEPFMSLTSFDARTKPGTTFGLKFDSALFLGAISLYHIVQGIKMGMNLQEHHPELRSIFVAILFNSALVSSSASITLLTTQSNLSLKGLTCWLAGVSILLPLGACAGSYSVPGKTTSLVCGAGHSVSAGLLLRVIFYCLLPRDLEGLEKGTRREFGKKVCVILSGACSLLALSFVLATSNS